MTRPLFVAGCPRSGTTALAEYLNEHDELLVCIERYKYVARSVTPSHFTFERILDYGEAETNIPRERHARLLARKDPAKLRWIGDKMPTYYKWYFRLLDNNPQAHFIVIHRRVEEVAASFEARAQDPGDTWPHRFEKGVFYWNQALRFTREFVESERRPRVLLLRYGDFFGGGGSCMPLLSAFLEVEFDAAVRKSWLEMTRRFQRKRRPPQPVSEEQALYVREHRDPLAEEWLARRIQRQRRDLLGPGA